jgi:orotidine-5'-phosphate decarboxylase
MNKTDDAIYKPSSADSTCEALCIAMDIKNGEKRMKLIKAIIDEKYKD